MSRRLPGEFRYFENGGTLPAEKARREVTRVLGYDPTLPDDVVRTWGETYYDADPTAEAFVEEVYLPRGQKEGRALVDRALAQGVASIPDAPASLVRLFDETEIVPAWVDWDEIELGARVFRRFGTHMFSFAGAVTLEAYRECSVAKPLAMTGAYTGESANRRFLETARFWVDVAKPSALRPGGKGRETALRVRLMHVFVRARLLRHPEWQLDAWGVPISQADALLTLLGGSAVPAVALKFLGYRTSDEETVAMMRFWRYVGHLMGVQPAFYPSTTKEAWGILLAARIKGCDRAGEDGKLLSRSYVASYAPRPDAHGLERLRQAVEYGLERGYVNMFVSSASRKHFGLPKAGPWALHPLAQAPLVFARETVRRRVPWADDLWDAWVRRDAERWVERRLGQEGAKFRAVETLRTDAPRG